MYTSLISNLPESKKLPSQFNARLSYTNQGSHGTLTIVESLLGFCLMTNDSDDGPVRRLICPTTR